jgi:hypothetical protein
VHSTRFADNQSRASFFNLLSSGGSYNDASHMFVILNTKPICLPADLRGYNIRTGQEYNRFVIRYSDQTQISPRAKQNPHAGALIRAFKKIDIASDLLLDRPETGLLLFTPNHGDL